jgi:hypothetical protein
MGETIVNGLEMVWVTSGENLICRWVDAEEQGQRTSASTQLDDSSAESAVKALEFVVRKVA